MSLNRALNPETGFVDMRHQGLEQQALPTVVEDTSDVWGGQHLRQSAPLFDLNRHSHVRGAE